MAKRVCIGMTDDPAEAEEVRDSMKAHGITVEIEPAGDQMDGKTWLKLWVSGEKDDKALALLFGEEVAVDVETLRRAAEEGPEARRWLEGNEHPCALASNRFASTEEAGRFVARLYELGAERVVVPPDALRPETEEGGAYADTLLVLLPEEEKARNAVVELCRGEADREGFVLGSEVEEGYVFLWWD